MTSEPIDVETLLRLAYGSYRVDRITPEMVLGIGRPTGPSASSSGFASFLALGTRVDTSGCAAAMLGGFSAAASTPDDMLTVHDAVLALPDFFVQWIDGDRVEISTEAELERAGGRLFYDAHGVGRVAHADGTIGRLERVVTSILVIQHARRADRPDWAEDGVQVFPEWNPANGKAMVIDMPNGGKACPILITPTPEQVARQRATYAVWARALDMLYGDLQARGLDTYHVEKAPISAAPWLDPKRVIHRADDSIAG